MTGILSPRRGAHPGGRSYADGRGRGAWSALVLVVAVVLTAPLAAVLLYALAQGSVQLSDGVGRMTLTTVVLLVAVASGTSVLGVGLAWLVSAYDFPLRGVLGWMLVLPLAMPAYVLGFVFLSTFDFAGPVQEGLRSAFGEDVARLPVRSLPGAALVLSLTLYPYVYLTARAAFLDLAPSAYDAARTLGASRARAFRQVLLPLARPSIAAGLALVMMETLTDFATVQYFNVRTVSVGVYLAWKGSFEVGSAISLALLVLVFAATVLAVERWLRGRARYHERGGRGRGLPRRRLTGTRAYAATAAAGGVLAVAFVLPVARLLLWAIEALGRDDGTVLDERFGEYLVNSAAVAAIAAGCCVTISVGMAHALRLGGGPLGRVAAQATTLGYAIPGAVIGIGVLTLFTAVDRLVETMGVEGGTGPVVTGSVLGVLFAYVVRFTAPAYQAVDAAFARIPESVTSSATTLGAGPGRLLGRIHLPLVRSGVAVALTLVLVDAVKELPLVLLLRPFGFTTLSVWVYELASENFWAQAALPALLIVGVAAVPVALLFRGTQPLEAERRLP